MVQELDTLEIIPILANDNISYKIDIIGDKTIDTSIIVIITTNYSSNDKYVYTFYIKERK